MVEGEEKTNLMDRLAVGLGNQHLGDLLRFAMVVGFGKAEMLFWESKIQGRVEIRDLCVEEGFLSVQQR